MSQSRTDILSNIRRALGVTGNEAPRLQAVEERIERAPKGIIPQRGQLPPTERLALFTKMAEGVQTTLATVAGADEIPQAVAAYLREHNLPATLRRGEDLRLKALPWQETTLDMAVGRSDGQDLNGISWAFAGVAETGTLVLTSGPENPTTLNFLPDNHIVVLNAKDVTGDIESMWGNLRFVHGKGDMPRTVNFITGPSRSGDIEQTILLGAHGPRRLHIIILGQA